MSKLKLNIQLDTDFEVDLSNYYFEGMNENQMKKANLFEAHFFANQRIGERYFRVELWVDLSSEKQPLIALQQFKELAIDDYLDSINADKNLENEGFVKLLS